MSEYQYYEFLAVDRQLTKAEMAELRAISSRAEITSRSFVNEYSYGDFKGDHIAFLAKYFDAHVYVANWGTHRFVVKVPKAVIDLKEINQYLHKYSFEMTETPTHVILGFDSDLEGGEWVEVQPWMSSMIGVRDELLKGDLRPFYLGWLAWVCNEHGYLLDSVPDEDDDDSDDDYEEDDESSFGEGEGGDELEPAVPPGMGELTVAQQSLAEFLRIPDDLLTAVAEASPALKADHDSSARLAEWIAKLPVDQKNAFLLELIQDDPGAVRVKLLSQFRAGELSNSKAEKGGSPRRRSIAQLITRANQFTQVKIAEEKRIKAEEAARKKAEAERRREEYLAALANTQEAAWKKIDSLIELRMAKSYAEIAIMLADLREVAIREKKLSAFEKRFERLIQPHLKKTSFISRLREAGLM